MSSHRKSRQILRLVKWLAVIAMVATSCSNTASDVAQTIRQPQQAPPTQEPELAAEQAVAAELQSDPPEPTTTTPPITPTEPEPRTEPTTEPTAAPVAAETESPAPTAVPTDEPQPSCTRIEDFGDDAADRWIVVNDGVMGGLSFGNVTVGGGVLRFEGVINTNGGGFSLVEASTLRDGASLVDALDGADFLRLRVRSENRRAYELMAEDSVTRSSRQIMHFAPLPISEPRTWEEVSVRLDGFDSRSFGRPVGAEEPFQPQLVRSIGIILADGVDGEFAIELDRIDACRS